MTTNAALDLIQQAMALSDDEQRDIANALVDGLEVEMDAEQRAEYRTAIEVGVQDIDAGRVVPWKQIKRELLERRASIVK